MKKPLIIFLLAFLAAACNSNQAFEEYYDFEEYSWNLDSIPSFEFSIEDREAKHVFVNVRNTISYGYQNLYLSYQLLDEFGNELESELINIPIFDEKTGKPFGSGSSIYEQRFQIIENYSFPKEGKYSLSIAQYMREIDLKQIVSIGVRIEEVN